MTPQHDCKHEAEFAQLRDDMRDIKSGIEKIATRLFVGNGVPAMATRIDRLEQAEKRRSKLIWAALTASVAAAIAAIKEAFTR